MKTHDEIQDLLERFVDETLDRETHLEISSHLAGCSGCRALLDEVPPVDLSALGGGGLDERSLRRLVRKAIRRTVLDTLIALVGIVVVAWLAGFLIVQPFLVNRDGRAAAAAQATLDLAVMLNPGAASTSFEIQSSAFRRRFATEVAMPLGSGAEALGTVEARIGVLGFADPSGGPLNLYLQPPTAGSGADQLAALAEGTVATASITFDDPISVAAAQGLADGTDHDVRVVWAGFSAPGPDGVLGYPTCQSLPILDPSFLAATGASTSGTLPGHLPASIDAALSETRRSIRNLLDQDEFVSAIPGPPAGAGLEAALTALTGADPRVATLVVTGPTSEVLGFVEDAGSIQVSVLAVGFYHWTPPLCGR